MVVESGADGCVWLPLLGLVALGQAAVAAPEDASQVAAAAERVLEGCSVGAGRGASRRQRPRRAAGGGGAGCRARVRRRSPSCRRVGGRAYRPDLLAALDAAGSERIVVTELARSRSVSASVFYPPLPGLEGLSPVRRLGPEVNGRRVLSARSDDAAWSPLSTRVDYLGVAARDETGTSK